MLHLVKMEGAAQTGPGELRMVHAILQRKEISKIDLTQTSGRCIQ